MPRRRKRTTPHGTGDDDGGVVGAAPRDSLLGDARRTKQVSMTAEQGHQRRAGGIVTFAGDAVERIVSENAAPTPTQVGAANIVTGRRTRKAFLPNAPGPNPPTVRADDMFPCGRWVSESMCESLRINAPGFLRSPAEWNFDYWGFIPLAWAYFEECHSPSFFNTDTLRMQRQRPACLAAQSGGGPWGAARAAGKSFLAFFVPEAHYVETPADGSCARHCLERMPLELRYDNASAEVLSFTPSPPPSSAPTLSTHPLHYLGDYPLPPPSLHSH